MMDDKTQPITVLLAEDNDDDVMLIRETFAQGTLVNILGVVSDGEEALAYLRRQGRYHQVELPGLVLLDINMPKKNGLEVLHEIKVDPSLRCLPVVMLTTSQREEDVVASYAQGACTFIQKPVKLGKLSEVIKQFELYWALVARIPRHAVR